MPLYITSATHATVPLATLLYSRERRQTRQQQWLEKYSITLISFTVVVPGPVKDTIMTRRIFNNGLRALRHLLDDSGWDIHRQRCAALPTGAEGLLAVSAPAHELKRALITLEQASPLGRLWDFDVLSSQGNLLSRSDFSLPVRRCLLCEQPATVCARERAHPLADLLSKMEALLHTAEATLPA